MAQCQGSRTQMVTFLVFNYIWQEDVAKISRALKALHHVNLARANTGLGSATIILFCTIF